MSRALIRSMSAEEAANHLDRTFSQHRKLRVELINRLYLLCEEDMANQEVTRRLTEELMHMDESFLPGPRRQTLDAALGALVAQLPREEQLTWAKENANHYRSRRRQKVYEIIRRHFPPGGESPLPADFEQILVEGHNTYGDYGALVALMELTTDRVRSKQLLLSLFDTTGDSSALAALVKLDVPIADVAVLLLENLYSPYAGDKQYLLARVLELLVNEDLPQALELAPQLPIAFAWGAGRARCREALPMVLRILEERRHDYENLSMLVWALGRLGATTELQELAKEFNAFTILPRQPDDG